MENFVINIGRQLGSGGRAIGHILAREFGIAYYDREILELAARESGFCTEVFERHDEHKSFFRAVFGNLMPFFGNGSDFYDNQLSEESLFRLQSEAIRKVAAERACIFIGRCADYVLREHPRRVNVFVAADTADRIARIRQAHGIDERAARRLLEQGDARRAEFYNFYSRGRWGAAGTYDLCINSSVLGIERTAQFIKHFVEQKLDLATP